MGASRRGAPGVPQPLGLSDRVVTIPRRVTQRLRAGKRSNAPGPSRPGVSLSVGFAGLIGVGTALLMLPFASEGGGTDVLTALFTATSAVCVTGLTVVSTADHWTAFGEAVILALIQVGALGFVVGAVVILTLAGRRTSSRERLLFGHPLGLDQPGGMRGLVWRVAAFTLLAEAIGFGLILWMVSSDAAVENPLWWSAFHAISAFTNAGFNVEPGAASMARLVSETNVLAVFGVLSVIGGIGFTVIFDVLRRRSWRRFALETRLVLTTFLIVSLAGFVVLLVLTPTFGGAVPDDDLGRRTATAAFHTINRTSGLTSVDLGALGLDALIAIMLLMFIGGASASVAGGVTLNTVGVLGVAAFSHIRGRRVPEAFNRTIATVTVTRALTVVLLSAMAIFVATLVMSVAERGSGQPLGNLLFESISAFAVVGYSTGITPDLSVVSKLVLVLAMFVGRLGALTLAQALVTRERPQLVKLPEEAIKVG